MRIVLVHFQPSGVGEETAAHMEALYTVALGKALAELDLNPWIICNRASYLSSLPLFLPRFCIDLDGFWDFLRLWQWQRQEPAMWVCGIGGPSLRLARRLYKMGPRQQRKLAGIFLLEAPSRDQKALLANAAVCICGSSFIARELGQISVPILQTAPAVDVAAYRTGRPWETGSRFIFGMGGSLLPHSGALLAVRAMAALWQHEELPPWEVRMFGGGDRFKEVMEEAGKLGVLPRLAILGEQALPEAAGLCHVWLSPGISDTEMPWVLWAGFAARIPVICAESPLHRERLGGQKGAMSISADNPQEMARAMLNTMRDADLRERLVAASAPMLAEIDLPGLGSRFSTLINGLLHKPQSGEETPPKAD